MKNHKCKTCGKAFGLALTLKNHIISVHEGVKKFKCETCGFAFGLAGNLKKHKSIHEQVKTHKCETCGKFFATKQNLNRHIQSIHDGVKNQKEHVTIGCAFTLSTEKDLIKTESNELVDF